MTKTKWIICSITIGLIVGLSSSIFLHSLKLVTNLRLENSWIIIFLPLIGLLIGFIYYRFGKDVEGGNNQIISQIHKPNKVIPLKMAPFILVTTLLTHLFGGSAGREGTAVQMGSALADRLTLIFKGITPNERKILLIAGAGAGFGSAIGTPIAGIIFGMEMLYIGRLKIFALFQCCVASFIAYYFCIFLNTPHSIYEKLSIDILNWKYLIFSVVAGLLFGLVARLFSKLTHIIESLNIKFIKYPPLRPFVAGLILVGLYYLEGSFKYAGLGLSTINSAFIENSEFQVPFLKMLFTAITVGSGFKGGEFIPLVYMGSTFGSFLSTILPVPIKLLTALGSAAVFGAAANAPIACAIMAIELFGVNITVYAILSCYSAYLISGYSGIYKTQLNSEKKFSFLKEKLKLVYKSNH